MRRVGSACGIIWVTTVGCGITGPGEERVVGRIDMDELELRVIVPRFSRGEFRRAPEDVPDRRPLVTPSPASVP